MSSFDYNPQPDNYWDSLGQNFSAQDQTALLTHLAAVAPGYPGVPGSTVEAEDCENALYHALGMNHLSTKSLFNKSDPF